MDLPEPTESDELCDATGIIAVGFVSHGTKPGFHMTALEADCGIAGAAQFAR
jgi:hypothetical protein